MPWIARRVDGRIARLRRRFRRWRYDHSQELVSLTIAAVLIALATAVAFLIFRTEF